MLFSHLWLFMFICVFVHQLTLMKIIGLLGSLKPYTICIVFQFCLGTICHEIWMKNTFFGNYLVQFPPHNTLNFYVLWLHVTHYNHHHFIINWIIHVASWGHPSNTLDMIKHEPTCFKIAPRLHLFIKSRPLPSPFIDILKRNIFSIDICLRNLLLSWM